MSAQAMMWARQQRTGNAGCKAVLLLLADMANPTTCCPGQVWLAEVTEQSERSVRTHLCTLESMGLISRRKRYIRGERTSDTLVLNVDAAADPQTRRTRVKRPPAPTCPACSTPAPAGSRFCPQCGVPMTAPSPATDAGDVPATDSASSPATVAGRSPATDSVPTGNGRPFDRQQMPGKQKTGTTTETNTLDLPVEVDVFESEFWTVYPRREGKAAARAAFVKATKKVGTDVVLAGAKRFAADPNLPDRQYIPHPATWLNQGRWDDEPLPPRLSTGRPGRAEQEQRHWALIQAAEARQADPTRQPLQGAS